MWQASALLSLAKKLRTWLDYCLQAGGPPWQRTGEYLLDCHYKSVDCRKQRRNGGRIFFSRVDFLCWLLFRYPFHPRVTAVARKRPRSFCQKCRWQVTAKHAYTYVDFIEPCFGIGHNLSLICQMTSEDIKHQLIIIKQRSRQSRCRPQELCEEGGGPGLSNLSHSSPVPNKHYGCVDVKHQERKKKIRAQEMCEQGGQDRERVARGDSRPLVMFRPQELW